MSGTRSAKSRRNKNKFEMMDSSTTTGSNGGGGGGYGFNPDVMCSVLWCSSTSDDCKIDRSLVFIEIPLTSAPPNQLHADPRPRWIEIIRDSRKDRSWMPKGGEFICSKHLSENDKILTNCLSAASKSQKSDNVVSGFVCTVKSCQNTSKDIVSDRSLTFHSLRRVDAVNESKRQRLIEIIRKSINDPKWTPTGTEVVCSKHFSENDIFEYYKKNQRSVEDRSRKEQQQSKSKEKQKQSEPDVGTKLKRQSCAIPGCTLEARKREKDVSFYRFPFHPSHDVTRNTWTEVVRKARKDPSWNPCETAEYICSRHFSPSDIIICEHGKNEKSAVKTHAVPSRNLEALETPNQVQLNTTESLIEPSPLVPARHIEDKEDEIHKGKSFPSARPKFPSRFNRQITGSSSTANKIHVLNKGKSPLPHSILTVKSSETTEVPTIHQVYSKTNMEHEAAERAIGQTTSASTQKETDAKLRGKNSNNAKKVSSVTKKYLKTRIMTLERSLLQTLERLTSVASHSLAMHNFLEREFGSRYSTDIINEVNTKAARPMDPETTTKYPKEAETDVIMLNIDQLTSRDKGEVTNVVHDLFEDDDEISEGEEEVEESRSNQPASILKPHELSARVSISRVEANDSMMEMDVLEAEDVKELENQAMSSHPVDQMPSILNFLGQLKEIEVSPLTLKRPSENMSQVSPIKSKVFKPMNSSTSNKATGAESHSFTPQYNESLQSQDPPGDKHNIRSAFRTVKSRPRKINSSSPVPNPANSDTMLEHGNAQMPTSSSLVKSVGSVGTTNTSHCVVPGCTPEIRGKESPMFFYTFSTIHGCVKTEKWTEVIRRVKRDPSWEPNYGVDSICLRHFPERFRYYGYDNGQKLTFLTETAVPCLNLPKSCQSESTKNIPSPLLIPEPDITWMTVDVKLEAELEEEEAELYQ